MAQEYDHDDIEYQFQDDLPPASEGQSSQKSAPPGSSRQINLPPFLQKINRRKAKKIILISVVILIVLIIDYKLFNLVIRDKKEKSKAQESAVSVPVAPKPVEMQFAPPVTQSTAAKESDQRHAVVLDELQEKVEKEQTQNKEVLDQLTAQHRETQHQLTNLSRQVSSVDDNLGGLQETVDGLKSRLRRVENARKEEARRKALAFSAAQKAIRDKKQYAVEAVVAGRAWLRGLDGSTVTITKGDILPGYGKILLIDAYSGRVATVLGGTINYGLSS